MKYCSLCRGRGEILQLPNVVHNVSILIGAASERPTLETEV